MKNIFCTTTTKTDEGYKNIIKNRMKIIIGFMLIGIMTLLIGILGKFYFKSPFLMNPVNNESLIIYTAFGLGLFAVGSLLLIKNMAILKDKEKLRKSRLNNTDERNLEISRKSLNISAYIMLASLYFICLIGGIFYSILFNLLSVMVCIFLLTYVISYKYYNKKM